MRPSGSKRTWIGCEVWKPGDRGDVKREALDTSRCWDIGVGHIAVAIQLEVQEKWWEAGQRDSQTRPWKSIFGISQNPLGE